MKKFPFLWCFVYWLAVGGIATAQQLDTVVHYELIRNEQPSNLLWEVVLKDGRGNVLAVCRSQKFDVQDQYIRAEEGKITLYLHHSEGQIDSIVHSNVFFQYSKENYTLRTEIPATGNYPPYYISTLHQVELEVPIIEWQIKRKKLYLVNEKSAICITSFNYFNAALMEAYQGLGTTNPLVKMALYAQKMKKEKVWFDVQELALLLDKRLEGVVLMDEDEVKKAEKNPTFKIIREQEDFRVFQKGYPLVFKFAGIDVQDLKQLFSNTVLEENVVLPLYWRMVKDGFLIYEESTKRVQLQQKLFHYVAAINQESISDYDHLKFCTEEGRVVLNMETQELLVPNVKNVILSMPQQVVAVPRGNLSLLPYRNLKFDGQLYVGKTCFSGRNIQFNYQGYQVNLPKINRLQLAIYKRARIQNEWRIEPPVITLKRALDEKGKPTHKLEYIPTAIEEGSGYLLMDSFYHQPKEQTTTADAPVLVLTSKTKAYYEPTTNNQNVIYPRKNFYFELEPFYLKQLNDLNLKDFIFKGKFYSSKILPVLNNHLTIQLSDLSLGFDTTIIGKRIPIYWKENIGGKGMFSGQIKLSNKGLEGNGRLTYLNATLGCDVFNFQPEQVIAKQVDSLIVRKTMICPKIKATHLRMLWKPYENCMYLNSLFTEGFPFHFYYNNQIYKLDGQLQIGAKETVGKGTLDWEQAVIVSNPDGDYKIGASRLTSNSVDLLLKIKGMDQFGIECERIRMELDFEREKARFVCQDKNTNVAFPYNGYVANCKELDWDWQSNLLYLEPEQEGGKVVIKREGSKLSFPFYASKGRYDLNHGLLHLIHITPIRIGNAFLHLHDSVLTIESDAYIEDLTGTFVIHDTFNYSLDSMTLIWNNDENAWISQGSYLKIKSKGEKGYRAKGKVVVEVHEKGLMLTYGWLLKNADWIIFEWQNGILKATAKEGKIGNLKGVDKSKWKQFKAHWL